MIEEAIFSKIEIIKWLLDQVMNLKTYFEVLSLFKNRHNLTFFKTV